LPLLILLLQRCLRRLRQRPPFNESFSEGYMLTLSMCADGSPKKTPIAEIART